MNELLNQLLDKAKTDKKLFRQLKELSVSGQQFELAARLREAEKDLFLETHEEKEAKERGDRLNLLFRMLDLNVKEDIAWMMEQAILFDRRNPGQFSISDAVELQEKAKKIFDIP